MKFMYLSIKYRYSDILLKKNKHLNRLFCCNHTCYCVNMVFVTSASRYITPASYYHPRYQSRSSIYIVDWFSPLHWLLIWTTWNQFIYIGGPIPRNFAEIDEAVPIVFSTQSTQKTSRHENNKCWLGRKTLTRMKNAPRLILLIFLPLQFAIQDNQRDFSWASYCSSYYCNHRFYSDIHRRV